jgi:hypothetical protein
MTMRLNCESLGAASARERAGIRCFDSRKTKTIHEAFFVEPFEIVAKRQESVAWNLAAVRVGLRVCLLRASTLPHVEPRKHLCHRGDSTNSPATSTMPRRRWTSFRMNAGLIIVVAVGAKVAAAQGLVGSDWPGRAMMAVIGAFLMATGNAIPKTLRPLSACPCDPATLQQRQRRAGWTFALAGAVLTIGWLALPEALANLLMLVLAPVTALFLVQMLRVCRTDRPASGRRIGVTAKVEALDAPGQRRSRPRRLLTPRA